PYGGGMWNTWFDRELSIAGKVSFLNQNNELSTTLIDFEAPIAIIPSIAPHLDKSFDSDRILNKQTDLPPVIAIETNPKVTFGDYLKKLIPTATEIIDSELFFYPVAKATQMGINNDFIVANALDNLLSCFVIAKAICHSVQSNSIAVFNDHEECGSISTTGADGSFLSDTLHRICGNDESFYITKANSLMISLDNAHAVHPNNPSRHEPSHQPYLNSGPVIKINANQRYATNSAGSTIIKLIAKSAEVPLQTFVARSDLGCGSTIGPVTSAILGINTIDLGIPTFAMHSSREIAGSKDAPLTTKLISAFYNYSK
ncbi:MAG: M18 family aminopeptidase, partial [Lentisphaeria bacterium]